jgi:hypothetical protein
MKNLTKGSVVKVTKKQKYHEFSVGDKVTIWSQSANNAWYATGEEGVSGWLFEEDMEDMEEVVIKYVPEVGDIVRIVGRSDNHIHYAIVGSLGAVYHVNKEEGVVVISCITQFSNHEKANVNTQTIIFEDIEKVGEQIKDETEVEPTEFNVLDKVWVKGTIRSRLNDGGKYGVVVEDYGVYGDSTIISAKPSQIKRR